MNFNYLEKINKYRTEFILFFFSFFVFNSLDDVLFGSDSAVYFIGGKNIFNGIGYFVNDEPIYFPIGYSLLMQPFFFIFGDSIESALLLTTFIGSLNVVLCYLFMKKFVNKDIAFLMTFFVIFSYYFWRFSSSTYSDVPATFFITLSIFFGVSYLNEEKYTDCLFMFVFASIATLVRFTSPICLVITGLLGIYKGKIRLILRKEVWFGLFLFIILLSPQLEYNDKNFGGHLSTGYDGYAKSEDTFALRYTYEEGHNRPAFKALILLKDIFIGPEIFSPFLFPLYLLGIYYIYKKEEKELGVLLFLWIFTHYLIAALFYTYVVRYLIPVIPALIILASFGIDNFLRDLANWKFHSKFLNLLECFNSKLSYFMSSDFSTRNFAFFLIGLLLLPSLLYSSLGVGLTVNRHVNEKETFEWINANIQENDCLLIPGVEVSYSAATYYIDGEIFRINGLNTTEDSGYSLHDLILSYNKTYIIIPFSGLRAPDQIENDAISLLQIEFDFIKMASFKADNSNFSLILNLLSKMGLNDTRINQEWIVYIISKG